MHPKLFASLVEAIEKWSADACETPEWERLDIYWADNNEQSMATAAAAVFDTVASTVEAVKAEIEG